jgi:hypothetical protein
MKGKVLRTKEGVKKRLAGEERQSEREDERKVEETGRMKGKESEKW